MASWDISLNQIEWNMKTLRFLLAIMVFGFALASCEDPVVEPHEDDPIDIPPPPYKP
jgi:hypothetical protein